MKAKAAKAGPAPARSPSPAPAKRKTKAKPPKPHAEPTPEPSVVGSTSQSGADPAHDSGEAVSGVRPRRGAAVRADSKLRNDIMPDLMNYEKDRKRGVVRGAWEKGEGSLLVAPRDPTEETEGWRPTPRGKKRLSMGGDEEEDESEKGHKGAKRRKVIVVKRDKAKAKERVESEDEEGTTTSVVVNQKSGTTEPKSVKLLLTRATLPDSVLPVRPSRILGNNQQ